MRAAIRPVCPDCSTLHSVSQNLLDLGNQGFAVQWFLEDGHGTEAAGGVQVICCIEAASPGHGNDGDIGVLLAQKKNHLEAVDIGHYNVGDYDFEWVGGEDAFRFGTIGGRFGFDAREQEGLVKQGAHLVVVVDY